MLSEDKLARLNFLARKKKTKGLDDVETAEQQVLRQEYLANFRDSFKRQLDNIEIVDPEDIKKGDH